MPDAGNHARDVLHCSGLNGLFFRGAKPSSAATNRGSVMFVAATAPISLIVLVRAALLRGDHKS